MVFSCTWKEKRKKEKEVMDSEYREVQVGREQEQVDK